MLCRQRLYEQMLCVLQYKLAKINAYSVVVVAVVVSVFVRVYRSLLEQKQWWMCCDLSNFICLDSMNILACCRKQCTLLYLKLIIQRNFWTFKSFKREVFSPCFQYLIVVIPSIVFYLYNIYFLQICFKFLLEDSLTNPSLNFLDSLFLFL